MSSVQKMAERVISLNLKNRNGQELVIHGTTVDHLAEKLNERMAEKELVWVTDCHKHLIFQITIERYDALENLLRSLRGIESHGIVVAERKENSLASTVCLICRFRGLCLEKSSWITAGATTVGASRSPVTPSTSDMGIEQAWQTYMCALPQTAFGRRFHTLAASYMWWTARIAAEPMFIRRLNTSRDCCTPADYMLSRLLPDAVSDSDLSSLSEKQCLEEC